MLILVRNGNPTMSAIERSETLPDIFDATTRYSLPRPSFSRVPFRKDEVVPLEKALAPSDIQIPPRVNTQKLSATTYRIEEAIRNTLARMRVFFCHQRSAIYPDGICMIIAAIYPIPV